MANERMRALYSIIQYMPDHLRGEVANMGVVLFIPQKRILVHQTSPTLHRVYKFFDFTLLQVNNLKTELGFFTRKLDNVRPRLHSEDHVRRLIGSMVDHIRMSDPIMISISDIDESLRAFYHELVGEYEPPAEKSDDFA